MVADSALERDEEKWKPVFRPHPAPETKNLTEAEHA
ncbi:hypothetical protein ACSSVZ_000925 [Amorphus sp. MBR-141]